VNGVSLAIEREKNILVHVLDLEMLLKHQWTNRPKAVDHCICAKRRNFLHKASIDILAPCNPKMVHKPLARLPC
jgi:hypothetical protein